MSPVLPDWNDATIRHALATHDIASVLQTMRAAGWTQRAIAELLGMRQSDVSEVLHGRKVQSVELLERIAEALNIPRGLMGLAYSLDAPRIKTRDVNMVEHALNVMVGEEGERVEYLSSPVTEYRRIGKADAHVINELFLTLQRLDQQHSGQLIPAQALIRQIRTVLRAEMSEDVRARLAKMEGWVNSFAGWCAIDTGNYLLGMQHFGKALSIAGENNDDLGKCRALFSSGKAEMHYGDAQQALKLYQLAVIPASNIGSKLYTAAFASHSAWTVSMLKPEHVQRHVSMTWDAYSSVRPEREYEGMHSFFNRTDLLGVTGQAQVTSAPERAIEDLRECVAQRREGSRSRAFETATLAHAYLEAGYADKALKTGRDALAQVKAVNSKRKAVRLAPLRLAAQGHGSDDMRSLARAIYRVA
ncbi:helix-turn-helix transcriptional regulator [Amycolatopsis sp. Poz14]|uniref:helix-turn-helix domain-containing protein n=1 Tax=Amycolatopsis sp. Poz14 TaxID=1447705 RepID=UPI001EE99310|nr:helix-turn-helix transcriptional regulator [Amycolatopsis sp. Poz14]MCG3754673.1 helix-turn-helix transcriptional regulator [Amycolatopsis sp. Poz14]